MVAIGINGFGRIGRLAVRESIARGSLVTAINDPFISIEYMAYLLKYDSNHGRLHHKISIRGKNLIIDNKHQIRVFNHREPKHVPWSDAGVKYVIESSGVFVNYDKVSQHFKHGVKRVVVSSQVNKVPMFVYGVNMHRYDPSMKIISNAASTTNCLATILKVIHSNFDLLEGLITTTHSATSSQKAVDSFSAKDWRIGRSCMRNIIPISAGAAQEIGEIIPEMKNKIGGVSIYVPVTNGCLIDLTLRFGKPAKLSDIKESLYAAAKGEYKNILGYTDEMIISSDFTSDTRSAIFDANASMALSDSFVKLIAWYDNEYGFTCRLFDMIHYIHNIDDITGDAVGQDNPNSEVTAKDVFQAGLKPISSSTLPNFKDGTKNESMEQNDQVIAEEYDKVDPEGVSTFGAEMNREIDEIKDELDEMKDALEDNDPKDNKPKLVSS